MTPYQNRQQKAVLNGFYDSMAAVDRTLGKDAHDSNPT